MRTHVSWSLALSVLALSGSLFAGCKSSKDRQPSDGGTDGGEPITYDIRTIGTTGLQTSEDGQQARFSVALGGKPTSNVVIPLSSSDTGEGTVVPAQLVFTPENYAGMQTVTITGVNDDDQDGPVTYKIILAAAQSEDANYSGKKANDVDVTNVDNDTAGVRFVENTGLETSEPNTTETFGVRLNTRPSNPVTLTFTSSDSGEVTVSPASVTFTVDNWAAPQPITLTGVNDDEVDGPQTVTITTAVASGDPRYAAASVPSFTVVNKDDETPDLRVSQTSGLETGENGDYDSFFISLNAAPTADVTITISSSDEAEAKVATTTHTFTANNWNSQHEVIVTGQNDEAVDGNKAFTITVSAASTDARFQGKTATVGGINIDDETAGVSVSGVEGLFAIEGGRAATFTVRLNAPPTATVTLPIGISDIAQATVAPSTLTFTTENWASQQTVTVTAVDDTTMDGAQQVTVDLGVLTSGDANYAGIDPPNPTVAIIDNDSAFVVIRPTGVTTPEGDLITNEGGAQASFTVSLTVRPTGNVTIPITSSDVGEVTAAPASLVFTTSDWASQKTVTLTGINDDLRDGDQRVNITVGKPDSTDAAYAALNPVVIRAVNVDDDSAGVTITPRVGLTTTESGGTATFEIRLNGRPNSNVRFTLASSDLSEGTVDASAVTFTPENYAAPQQVTVTGVNDDVADGSPTYRIVFGLGVSDDPGYNNFEIAPLELTNTDNDTPAILVQAGSLSTSEAGSGTATFTVRLATIPSAPVVIPVVSRTPTEGVATPASLTFDATNWSGLQTVTVTGQQDLVADGSQLYYIGIGPATSADTGYSGITHGDVPVVNTDDDSAGFLLSRSTALPPTLRVRESGSRATFYVQLNSRPTAEVRIAVTSSNPAEGTISTNEGNRAELVFTPDNWNSVDHIVTATGVGDLIADGNQTFYAVFGAITSTDAVYATQPAPANMPVRNVDIDGPGITVTPSTVPLVTTELGGETTFQIELGDAPTAAVRIPFEILTEGAASAETWVKDDTDNLSFVDFELVNPMDPAMGYSVGPLVVTLKGRDDFIADADKTFQVRFLPAISEDPKYAGRTVADLAGVNVDNDSPGITVAAPPAPTSITEAAGLAHTVGFTVTLNSQPTASVTIPITLSSGQATRALPSMVFGPGGAAWNSLEPNTIIADDDFIADGPQDVVVTVGPAVSTDPNYSGRSGGSFTVTVVDDDSPGINAIPPLLFTSETGAITAPLALALNSQPTFPVTLNLTVEPAGEVTFAPSASVTFAPNGTYNVAQVVTIQPVDDAVAEISPDAYTVTITAVSDDPNYGGRTITVPGTNLVDNDTPNVAVTLSNTPALVGGNWPAIAEDDLDVRSFAVVLTSQPTADVTVAIASSDTSEATVSASSLTFTGANWNVPQVVNVTPVPDDFDDGNIGINILVAAAASADPFYAGRAASISSIPLTVSDNDDSGYLFTTSRNGVVYEQNTTATATFSVRLSTIPSADVTITLGNTDPTEGVVSPATLTFTPGTWNVPQSFTVTAVDDRIRDYNQSFQVTLTPTSADPAPGYNNAGLPAFVANVESWRSCDQARATLTGPLLSDGNYLLDPDLEGPIPRFWGYCDMTTDGGGWTLLAWSADTEVEGGVPYPGLVPNTYNDLTSLFPLVGAPRFHLERGTGVPSIAAANGLLANSTQLAQGQGITITGRKGTFDNLGTYEFAAAIVFPSPLVDLQLSNGNAVPCAGLGRTGLYRNLNGAVPPDIENPMVPFDAARPIYVNQALHGAFFDLMDYSNDAADYVWSIGNVQGYCARNGASPGSFVGTWQATQYGPGQVNAAGSYSVWVR